MKREERLELILKTINNRGKVTVNTLAKKFEMTPETIRRDLTELQANEQITRIHGAAVPYIPVESEMVFEKKMNTNEEIKKRIAKYALNYIHDSDTIAIDVGTTTVHLGHFINGIENLTIVTNSMAAAGSFSRAIEEERITGQVIILPGFIDPFQSSIKGSYTAEFIKKFHFNHSFISCGGLTEESIYDFDIEESLISLLMIQNSDQSSLLVDSSKLNQKRNFKISEIELVDNIICDQAKPYYWKTNQVSWPVIN